MVVEATGAARAQRDLEAMGRRAQDVKPLDQVIRGIFLKAEEARFQGTEQRPRWKPLADSTRERKAREGQDPRTLRATQVLHRSLTEPGAAMQVDEPTTGSFRFGTKVPYAFYHDTGTGVPKRKLVGLSKVRRTEVNDHIADFIAKAKAF